MLLQSASINLAVHRSTFILVYESSEAFIPDEITNYVLSKFK